MNKGKELRARATEVNELKETRLRGGPGLNDAERQRIVNLGLAYAKQDAEAGNFETKFRIEDFKRDEEKEFFNILCEEDAGVIEMFRKESVVAKFNTTEFCRDAYNFRDCEKPCRAHFGYILDWSKAGETPKNLEGNFNAK
jgi:hypothetical protein